MHIETVARHLRENKFNLEDLVVAAIAADSSPDQAILLGLFNREDLDTATPEELCSFRTRHAVEYRHRNIAMLQDWTEAEADLGATHAYSRDLDYREGKCNRAALANQALELGYQYIALVKAWNPTATTEAVQHELRSIRARMLSILYNIVAQEERYCMVPEPPVALSGAEHRDQQLRLIEEQLRAAEQARDNEVALIQQVRPTAQALRENLATLKPI